MTRWLIWTGYVVAWTIALEAPVKAPEDGPVGAFILDNKVLVMKSIHVSVYVVMTILSAWVRTPTRYRWLMMGFLMIHATGTELLQWALEDYCHRSGNLKDVGWDNLGILIGVIVSWKWWTRPDPGEPGA